MKINYDKLVEVNRESLNPNGDQLSSFWVIQHALEAFMEDRTTNTQKELLIELEILEEEPHENIVKPFSMTNSGN